MIDGIAVIDKPAGITSHDVVARARRALAERRIGHAGTLDPPATGVLILGVGRATRLMRFAEAYEKEYTGTIVFGATTTTLDATGQTLTTSDPSGLTAAAVRQAAAALTGDILQIPPMVSAVKVGGERLYAKARRGEDVEREARPVRVAAFEVNLGADAIATFRVVCSRGTYVRVLAADLGEALGVGAHLGALRRTRVGPFADTDATPLDDLDRAALRPMDALLAGYPRRVLTDDEGRAIITGRRIPAAGIEGPYAAFTQDALVAVLEDRGEEAASLCVVAAQ